MKKEPPSPKAEFMMAIAGPLSSIFLALMTRTGSSRLMVTEGNRLAGIISLKDMMKFFELKVELES